MEYINKPMSRTIFSKSIEVRSLVVLLAVLLAAVFLRLWLFYGLVGSDDAHYAYRGLEVINGLWVPSSYVGDFRYGVSLPIALSVLIFGRGEYVLSIWGLLCNVLEIALVYIFAHKLWGLRAAWFSAVLMLVLPIGIASATNVWADAPFSLLLTASSISLYFAVSNKGNILFVLSGFLCGLASWVKFEPTFVFGLVLFLLLVFYCDNRTYKLFLVSVGAALSIGGNLLLFYVCYGDPLFYVKLASTNLAVNFVESAAPFGDHNPFFYVRSVFLDVQYFGIIPMLAIFGCVAALFEYERLKSISNAYPIVWGALVIAVFSFFVYRLEPLRFIPKQWNYALIFSAPISLVAGKWLSERSLLIRGGLLVGASLSALILSVIHLYGQEIRAWSNRSVVNYASRHHNHIIYASEQAVALSRVQELLSGRRLDNLKSLAEVNQFDHIAELNGKFEKIVIANYPLWPEARNVRIRDYLMGSDSCVKNVQTTYIQPDAKTRAVLYVGEFVKRGLPSILQKHLGFIDPLINPEPLRYYEILC